MFRLEDSKESFIQNFDKEDTVTSFDKIEIENNISSINYKEYFINAITNKAVFVFVPPVSDVLIGNRSDISKKLEEIYTELENFPFSRHQVASFINNKELYLKAELEVNNILRKAKNSLFMGKVREVNYKNSLMNAVKLHKKMYRIIEIFHAPRLQAEMSYRAGRAILDHISFNGLSNDDYNFTLSQAYEDISIRFVDQYREGFSRKEKQKTYLTSSLKEAMKEAEYKVKFQKHRTKIGKKSKVFVLFESNISTVVCDLRGSQTFNEDELGNMVDVLYEHKVDGVIYSTIKNSFDFRLYLFTKQTVKDFKVTDFYEVRHERNEKIEWVNLTNSKSL